MLPADPIRPSRLPPAPVANLEFPIRATEPRSFLASLWPFRRGESPADLVPVLSWMHAMGATDIEDIAPIRAAFAGQLGPSWRGCENASVVTRVLLLRAAACFFDGPLLERIDSELSAIMASPVSAARDMAAVRSVADRHGSAHSFADWIDTIAQGHGYESTALVAVIRHVFRHKGIVALKSRDTPWLPFVDRRAWIAIHFTGLKAFAPECAGIYSHLAAEQRAGHALSEPHVDEAIAGLHAAWRDRLIRDRRTKVWRRAEALPDRH